MTPKWAQRRHYQHLDNPISSESARKADDPTYVQVHAWRPLIYYEKRSRRYKPTEGKSIWKLRPIMYSSHMDACILGRYAETISNELNRLYQENELNDAVIAYRRLGKANYHFAGTALQYVRDRSPCVALCIDVSGFFDNINHKILKNNLKRILAVESLPEDWFKVLRSVTKYSYVRRDELRAHPKFGKRMRSNARGRIAGMSELIKDGFPIHQNNTGIGIPQGTPISSVLSNLYMLDLDIEMLERCSSMGALYQRYSDDILIICSEDVSAEIELSLREKLAQLRLEVSEEKFERVMLNGGGEKLFQYLGFLMSEKTAGLRQATLSRQWRRARRALRAIHAAGVAAIAAGKSTKIHTKKLRKRFQPTGGRNFSRYARSASDVLRSRRIRRQVRRLEDMMDREIRALNEPSG